MFMFNKIAWSIGRPLLIPFYWFFLLKFYINIFAQYRYLRDTFQFIDQDKIGVYGWGYGGYIALNALAEDDSKVLQCAIAIAPIISFKFYCKLSLSF